MIMIMNRFCLHLSITLASLMKEKIALMIPFMGSSLFFFSTYRNKKKCYTCKPIDFSTCIYSKSFEKQNNKTKIHLGVAKSKHRNNREGKNCFYIREEKKNRTKNADL